MPIIGSDQDKYFEDNPAPTRAPNAGDKYFNEDPEDLKTSMFYASKKEPEQFSKVVRLADRAGVAPEFAERTYDGLSKKLITSQENYGELQRNSPGLARWFTTPENAALGRDDQERLAKVSNSATEYSLFNHPNGPLYAFNERFEFPLGRAALTGFSNMNASLMNMAAAKGLVDKSLAAEFVADANRNSQYLRSIQPQYAKDLITMVDKEGGDINLGYHRFLEGYGKLKEGKIREGLVDAFGGGKTTIGETLDFLGKSAKNPQGLLYSIVENAPYSLPAMIAGAAGASGGAAIGPVMAGLGFAGGTFGGEYPMEYGSQITEDLSKRGVDVTNADSLREAYNNPAMMSEIRNRANQKAFGTAAFDAALTPLSGIFLKGAKGAGLRGLASKGIRGLADVGVETLGEVGSEAYGQLRREGSIGKVDIGEAVFEGISSLGQSVGQIGISQTIEAPGKVKEAAGEPIATGQDMQAAFDEALGTLNQKAGEPAPGPSVRNQFNAEPLKAAEEISTQGESAVKTLQSAKSLVELGADVRQAKLIKRQLPAKVKDLITEATDGDPDAAVYFQIDDFDKYWQSQGISPVEAANEILPDGQKVYEEAKATGELMKIPLGDYVSTVATTQHFEPLMGIVRTNESGMSTNEAVTFMRSLPATIEEVTNEQKAVETRRAELGSQLRESVTQKFVQAKAPQEVASSIGKLAESFYHARAEDLGESPEQVLEHVGLGNVLREGINLPPERVKAIMSKAKSAAQPQEVFQMGAPVPTFYHQLQRTIDEKIQGSSATTDQVRAIIKNLKPEEVKWSGIEDFLKGKEKISKAELQEFLRANQVEVEEVVKGGVPEPDKAIIEELNNFGLQVFTRTAQDGSIVYALSDDEAQYFFYDELPMPESERTQEIISLWKELSKSEARAAKFASHVLPGGQNYRELLLRLPERDQGVNLARVNEITKRIDDLYIAYHDIAPDNAQARSEIQRQLDNSLVQLDLAKKESNEKRLGFRSSHFDEPNILAHVRFNDRIDSEGKRVLFLEEIQSDWHQQGRRKGYKGDKIGVSAVPISDVFENGTRTYSVLNKDGQEVSVELASSSDMAVKLSNRLQMQPGVPDAPFRKTWHEFALKRMIRYAAENGYDKIAWTTGEQQTDRYNLRKFLDEVEAHRNADGKWDVIGFKDNKEVVGKRDLKPEEMALVVGKDFAVKIAKDAQDAEPVLNEFGLRTNEWSKTYSGVDLEVGGEGQRGFYDDIIPKAAEKIARKFDKSAEVRDEVLPETGKVHVMEISEPLRDAALNEGFSLFQASQRDPEIPLGFYDPQSKEIGILKNANASTFIHEMMHHFMFTMQELSAKSEVINSDLNILRDYVGAKEGEILSRQHQEDLANAAMAYLFEGKSPSTGLRRVFDKFKSWLQKIYGHITNLGVELTPEVRDVFGRMFATDREIAEQSVASQIPAEELSDNQARELSQLEDEVRIEARERLGADALKIYRQEDRKQRRAEAETQRPGIEAAFNADKNFAAYALLKDGTKPNGEPLAEGIVPFKIDPTTLSPELAAKLPKEMTAEGGLNAQVAAGQLGFNSDVELVNTVSSLPEPKKAIKAAVDAAVVKELGDPVLRGDLPQMAIEAIHNDKASDLLAAEAAILAEKAGVRTPDRKIVMAELRKRVARQIGTKEISDIRPRIYYLAEVKFAREAGIAIAKKDYQAAYVAKGKQLLSHELFRAATEAKQTIEKNLRDFKKIFKSNVDYGNRRDTNFIDAARAVLTAYGLDNSEGQVQDYLAKMQNYDDEDIYHAMTALIAPVLQNAKPYRQTTYDEFQDMADSVMALWDQSLSVRQIQSGTEKMQRSEVINKLNDQIEYFLSKKKRPEYARTTGKWDKRIASLLGMKALGTITEHWAIKMDRGNSLGEFNKTFIQPVMDKIAVVNKEKKKHLDIMLKNLKNIEDAFQDKPIYSPELNTTFNNLGEVLWGIANTGTESNMSKLIRGGQGRGAWGNVDENGIVDTRRWDAFISRLQKEGILQKRHYDWIDSVWKQFRDMKPETQRAHKEMYGYYFNEVDERPVQTPWGTYEGGYVPLSYDTVKVQDQKIKKDLEAMEQGNNTYKFPTTGRGATKSRIEAYAAPLKLDLSVMPYHLDWAVRFSHLEPTIKQLARLVKDKSFSGKISELDNSIVTELLIPWLQRTATQKVSTPTGSGAAWRGIDAMARELRKRTGLNIMAGSLINAAQQFTGIFPAMTKVKPKHLRNAMWKYMTDHKDFVKNITDNSKYMETRTSAQMFEVMKNIEDILLAPGEFAKAREIAEKHGYFLQAGTQNIVDLITWAGAYDQAISSKEAKSHDEAVRYADSVVRTTQGSFSPESISRLNAGTPLGRLFNQFGGYFNNQANLLGERFATTAREMGLKKGAGKLLYLYTVGFMMPAVLTQIISMALSGKIDEDDDDEYLDDLMKAYFSSQFRYATAMIPYAGQTVNAAVGQFTKKPYDDRLSISPAVSAIESTVRAPKSIYKAIIDEGKHSTAIKDTMAMLGLMTGYPLQAIGRSLGYITDVAEGQIEPENKLDFTRGVVTGKSGK